MNKKIDLNNLHQRCILFDLISMLDLDIDGDFIELNGVRYYVNMNSNIIQILDDHCSNTKKLSMEGNLVLTPNIFDYRFGEYISLDGLEMLDDIHKEKIRISDKVFIVNPGGYIGEDTKKEIEYARSIGKKIMYLEEESSI